nr:MAG TPA: hypothetical protein [Caudoviricetes sp.]
MFYLYTQELRKLSLAVSYYAAFSCDSRSVISVRR